VGLRTAPTGVVLLPSADPGSEVVLSLTTLRYSTHSLAHLAVQYGGRQDARLEPKYILKHGLVLAGKAG
jgi:hypothetical protein